VLPGDGKAVRQVVIGRGRGVDGDGGLGGSVAIPGPLRRPRRGQYRGDHRRANPPGIHRKWSPEPVELLACRSTQRVPYFLLGFVLDGLVGEWLDAARQQGAMAIEVEAGHDRGDA
jgi:hypothetical protein